MFYFSMHCEKGGYSFHYHLQDLEDIAFLRDWFSVGLDPVILEAVLSQSV